MGYISADALTSDSAHMVTGTTSYHFGVLSSTMHNAWVRATCGRLESRYRYSKDIVYNNFPWPDLESKPAQVQAERSKSAIETAAEGVLDARARFPGSSLADLYDPLTMPPVLLKAHQKLDAAVDKAYELSGGKKTYKSDAERVAFLFELYQKYTSLLPAAPVKKARKRRRARPHEQFEQAFAVGQGAARPDGGAVCPRGIGRCGVRPRFNAADARVVHGCHCGA